MINRASFLKKKKEKGEKEGAIRDRGKKQEMDGQLSAGLVSSFRFYIRLSRPKDPTTRKERGFY